MAPEGQQLLEVACVEFVVLGHQDAQASERWPGIVSREKVAEAQCMSWTCDCTRAAAELGFQAATSLEEGLAETLAWYKEAGWLKY